MILYPLKYLVFEKRFYLTVLPKFHLRADAHYHFPKNINTILGKRDGKFHVHITVGSKRKKEPIKYFKLEDIKLND